VQTSFTSEACGPLLGGKYRLGKLLGRGGMGAVYAGRHARTGRPVAVKVLHADYVGDADVAGRFLREARVVAELKHPNVVDVLDLDEEPDGTVYMVLELLEGESFAALLRREGPLSVERAAEVLVPVMRALAFAHAHGVVHRDLKPENIFLHRDAEGLMVPKVLDFGIAWARDEELRPRITQNGYVMGTPEYMSPEQAAGIPDRIRAPSDVWSMGVLWYEALTGSLPFQGATIYEVMAAVSHAPFELPSARLPHLPPTLTAALDGALVRDVSRRYSNMDAFLAALLEAMARPEAPGSVALADEVTDPSPVVLRERHRKAPSAMALAYAFAALAGVATAGLIHRQPPIRLHAARPAVTAPAPVVRAPVARPPVVVAAAAAVAPVVVAPPPSAQVHARTHAARTRPDERARRANAVATRAVTRLAPPRAGAELPRPNDPLTDYDAVP